MKTVKLISVGGFTSIVVVVAAGRLDVFQEFYSYVLHFLLRRLVRITVGLPFYLGNSSVLNTLPCFQGVYGNLFATCRVIHLVLVGVLIVMLRWLVLVCGYFGLAVEEYRTRVISVSALIMIWICDLTILSVSENGTGNMLNCGSLFGSLLLGASGKPPYHGQTRTLT